MTRPLSRPVAHIPATMRRWIICQRCWFAGQTRAFDPRREPCPDWCHLCDMDPDTARRRQAEADRRHEEAREAALVTQSWGVW